MAITGEGGDSLVGLSLVSPRDAEAASGSQPSIRPSPSGAADQSQGSQRWQGSSGSRGPQGSLGSLELDPAVPGLLWLRGEVDLDVVGTTAAQRRAREELMDGVDVVDASQVTFIDSTGVHLLIVAATAARTRGTTLRLRRPADLLLALVQVMGLSSLFDVDTSN